MEVTAVLKIKHADLHKAAKQVGSQSALARHLGITATDMGRWCNLHGCPPKTWPKERLDDIERKLFELTGKSLSDIFPDSLRRECLKRTAPRQFERTVEVESLAMLEYAAGFTERMTLPSPDSKLENLETVELQSEFLEEVMGVLSLREREIVKARWGIGIERALSLEDVGKQFKVTRERVRQIEAKALRKMQCAASRCQRSDEILGDE